MTAPSPSSSSFNLIYFFSPFPNISQSFFFFFFGLWASMCSPYYLAKLITNFLIAFMSVCTAQSFIGCRSCSYYCTARNIICLDILYLCFVRASILCDSFNPYNIFLRDLFVSIFLMFRARMNGGWYPKIIFILLLSVVYFFCWYFNELKMF